MSRFASAPPPQRANFRVGQRLQSERQRVFEVLDVRLGGFGVVYTVQDLQKSRRVALKTFNARWLWSDEDRRCFEREAVTWISLAPHPNVVTASSVELIEGSPCLEMEYVAGADLGQLLASGPLSRTHAVRVAIQFCDGMGHASGQRGIVHRNIKPTNCLLTEDGVLKVTDFGLVQAYGIAQKAGVGVGLPYLSPGYHAYRREHDRYVPIMGGTRAYMAPEQSVAGARLDTRTDIYAFGVMLYRMLTGDPESRGRADVERSFWSGLQLSLEQLPSSLRRIIRRCTAPKRGRRPATFADVRVKLERIYWSLAGREAPPPGQRHLGPYQ